MNKTVLMGRLTADPQVRYSQGDNATAVARYTLAVDRRFRRDGEPTSCCLRAYSDRKLHKQGRKQGVYNRCSCGRTGVCRKQSSQSAESAVSRKWINSGIRRVYEYPGWNG